MNSIISLCSGTDCEYKENVSLSDYTSFKVGGLCKLMCFPDSEEKLIKLINHVRKEKIPFFVIGKGSNLLADDSGYDGIIINTCLFDAITVSDNIIKCSAGASLMKVCRAALENSLSGLEFAFGIPGSVGGAVFMNAGAYGGEMKNVISQVRYLSGDGNVRHYKPDELDFGYRHSVFSHSDDIIISAELTLTVSSYDKIKAEMDDLLTRRKEKQPLEFPSAGSTFKRPEGYYAGALIEECGLKGKRIGGAQVSEKHAGFIINRDNATAADIKNLIEFCRETVLKEKNVYLETEVRYI